VTAVTGSPLESLPEAQRRRRRQVVFLKESLARALSRRGCEKLTCSMCRFYRQPVRKPRALTLTSFSLTLFAALRRCAIAPPERDQCIDSGGGLSRGIFPSNSTTMTIDPDQLLSGTTRQTCAVRGVFSAPVVFASTAFILLRRAVFPAFARETPDVDASVKR